MKPSRASIIVSCCFVALLGINTAEAGKPQQIAGPASPSEQPAWLQQLKSDRDATITKIGYKGGVFATPELQWTQTSYIQPQMHPYDRFFYDVDTHSYTVEKYLADVKARYGGIDALLMWPTYTNIGIDDRNQFDLFRAMPGGLDAVANITAQLHEAGVKVLWPYNPWDKGTHRESLSDEDTFGKLLKETQGDGFNGDTMPEVPKSFWTAALKAGHPEAFEPEGGGEDDSLNWSTMGWGYYSYPQIPQVDRFKFITSGKFMTNICDRWAKDKTDNLQTAWFNGAGYESWENVWGTWNGITKRDGEAIRRVATMLRFFGSDAAGARLRSSLWEPHTPAVLQPYVYGSEWPSEADDSRLWSLVNRGATPVTGQQLYVLPKNPKSQFHDCYHGVPLTPEPVKPPPTGSAPVPKGALALSFEIEKGGFGCILETIGEPDEATASFLTGMKSLTEVPLSGMDATWRYLNQSMVEIPKTAPAASTPSGMIKIPAGQFNFEVKGVEIEGDDAHGVDVQYPWEENPIREHSKELAMDAFYLDKYPVTTTDYAAYLKATGFKPSDDYNYLKNWNGSSSPPAAIANMPVTYVSISEARAYCAWKGARLPHSYEWQYAAQGTDSRTYPWGSTKDQSKYPVLSDKNNFPGPEAVTAHSPAGDSPFGVADLVGNVWQYTDEFYDSHTRAVILRGGSNYRPTGSLWYFPQALELNTHNKYFLMDDRYERAGTIGFRCAVDA